MDTAAGKCLRVMVRKEVEDLIVNRWRIKYTNHEPAWWFFI